jgi:hypothetical protein
MDWEHDAKYTVSDMITYELSLIIQDAVLFSSWAASHSTQCRSFGLDRVVPIFTADYVLSFLHSATPVRNALHVAVRVLGVHVRGGPDRGCRRRPHVLQAVRTGVWLMKVIEITVTFFLLMGPLLTSPYFHLHHWFAGFFSACTLILTCGGVEPSWPGAGMLYQWNCRVRTRSVLTCGTPTF